MEYFQIACLIFVVYLCTYGIINRICNCIEKCSTNSSASRAISKTNFNLGKKENGNESNR